MLHMFYSQRMFLGPPFHSSRCTLGGLPGGGAKSQAECSFWRHLYSGFSRGLSVLRPLHLPQTLHGGPFSILHPASKAFPKGVPMWGERRRF